MKLLVVLLLLGVLAGVFFLDELQHAVQSVRESPATESWKWVDKSGRIHYGTEVPPGVQAERVDGSKANITVLPATKVPEPAASSAASDTRSLQDRMMERAVEQATK